MKILMTQLSAVSRENEIDLVNISFHWIRFQMVPYSQLRILSNDNHNYDNHKKCRIIKQTQQAFTCSKSTMETPEQCVKSIQS